MGRQRINVQSASRRSVTARSPPRAAEPLISERMAVAVALSRSEGKRRSINDGNFFSIFCEARDMITAYPK